MSGVSAFLWQAALWLLGAYFVGAWIGCLLRRLFTQPPKLAMEGSAASAAAAAGAGAAVAGSRQAAARPTPPPDRFGRALEGESADSVDDTSHVHRLAKPSVPVSPRGDEVPDPHAMHRPVETTYEVAPEAEPATAGEPVETTSTYEISRPTDAAPGAADDSVAARMETIETRQSPAEHAAPAEPEPPVSEQAGDAAADPASSAVPEEWTLELPEDPPAEDLSRHETTKQENAGEVQPVQVEQLADPADPDYPAASGSAGQSAVAAAVAVASAAAAVAAAHTVEDRDNGQADEPVPHASSTEEPSLAWRGAETAARPTELEVRITEQPAPQQPAAEPPIAAAPADDLALIKGVSAEDVAVLREAGVASFGAIADWQAGDVERLGARVGGKRRIARENWIEQAALLRAGRMTAHARRGQMPTAAVAAVTATVATAVATTAAIADPVPAIDNDLTLIRWLTRQDVESLNDIGVSTFDEIARWQAADVKWTSALIDGKERIGRENWIEQAAILQTGRLTAYARLRERGLMAPVVGVHATPDWTPPVLLVETETAPSAPEPVDTPAPAETASSEQAATTPQPEEAPPPATEQPSASSPDVDDRTDVSGEDGKVGAAPTGTETTAATAAAAAFAPITRRPPVYDENGKPATVAATPRTMETPQSAVAPSTDQQVAPAPGEAAADQPPAATVDQTAPSSETGAAGGRSEALSQGKGQRPYADDLKQIDGINEKVEQLLYEQGTTRVSQIAHWSEREQVRVDRLLGGMNRVRRENWVGQARRIIGLPVEAEPVPAVEAPTDADRTIPDGNAERSDVGALRSVRSQALTGAAEPATGDDLKCIRGINVLIERRLRSMGITTYVQIAAWTRGDIDRVNQQLDFRGRIERENWIDQAKILSSGHLTEFARRKGRSS